MLRCSLGGELLLSMRLTTGLLLHRQQTLLSSMVMIHLLRSVHYTHLKTHFIQFMYSALATAEGH